VTLSKRSLLLCSLFLRVAQHRHHGKQSITGSRFGEGDSNHRDRARRRRPGPWEINGDVGLSVGKRRRLGVQVGGEHRLGSMAISALRLAGFLIKHRTHVRQGLVPEDRQRFDSFTQALAPSAALFYFP
jgi:hypothetical protein